MRSSLLSRLGVVVSALGTLVALVALILSQPKEASAFPGFACSVWPPAPQAAAPKNDFIFCFLDYCTSGRE